MAFRRPDGVSVHEFHAKTFGSSAFSSWDLRAVQLAVVEREGLEERLLRRGEAGLAHRRRQPEPRRCCQTIGTVRRERPVGKSFFHLSGLTEMTRKPVINLGPEIMSSLEHR